VFLLDPGDSAQRAWLGAARRDLAVARVATDWRPLVGRDVPAAREIVGWVRTLPRPVVVVVPRTPFANGDRYHGTEAAGAFMDAYAQAVPGSVPLADRRDANGRRMVPAAGAAVR
jgi:hypothetical protein